MQPGSLRIESGVNDKSSMTIIDTENMQIVNGLVLDFESSLYICKFLARMVYNYTKTSQFFKENIFRSVLTTTVRQFVE